MGKKNKQSNTSGRKIVARNRKASHDYHLDDAYQAGLVLAGPEIKSIRNNQVNITDGFVQERDGELWLMGVHITPYKQTSQYDAVDPLRPRKLLLHKKEIARIITQIRERGVTMVPTSLYLERGIAKVDVAIARGKKLYDKRQSLAKREADRQIQRALKSRG